MRTPRLSASTGLGLALVLVLGLAVLWTGMAMSAGQNPSGPQSSATAGHGHGAAAAGTDPFVPDPSGVDEAGAGQHGAGDGTAQNGLPAGESAAAEGIPAILPDDLEPDPSKPANSPQRSLVDAAAQQPAAGVPRLEQGRESADRTAGLSERSPVAPTDALGDAAQGLGGCLQEYGAAGQCLPTVPPSLSTHLQQMKDAGLDPASMAHPWSCAEVRQYFPEGLAVRVAGADPQRLDLNADGTACGAAD